MRRFRRPGLLKGKKNESNDKIKGEMQESVSNAPQGANWASTPISLRHGLSRPWLKSGAPDGAAISASIEMTKNTSPVDAMFEAFSI